MSEQAPQGIPSTSLPNLPPVPPSYPPVPPPLPGLEGSAESPERPRRGRRPRVVETVTETPTLTAPPPLPETHTGPVTEPVTVGQSRPQTTPPPIPVAEGNAKPKFWASVGATINIGNYESMKLDMGVSGIDYDASSQEIERIMASADVGIHETIEALMIKVIDRAREIKIARGLPVGGDE